MKLALMTVMAVALMGGEVFASGENRGECSQGTAYQPSGTTVVAFTSGTTTVSSFTSHTDVYRQRFRIVASQDALVTLDKPGVVSPSATNGMKVVAGAPEYFCVGRRTNLGVVSADGNTGTINVTRMVR